MPESDLLQLSRTVRRELVSSSAAFKEASQVVSKTSLKIGLVR